MNTTQKDSSSTPDQKKKLALSPFKSPTQSNPLIIQNKYSPLTPPSTHSPLTPYQNRPLYSSLIKKPVTILSNQSTPSFSKKSSSTSSGSSYFVNPNQQIVKILDDFELQLHSKGFHFLTDFLFPKDSYFIGNIYKDREFYQAILVDTGSIRVTHKSNSSKSDHIDFSKVQILRVLSIEEWGTRPYNEKVLSNFPQHPSFNYYDYQEAWFNFLYLRSYSHSWFIFFDKNFNHKYPRWFVKWFKYLGSLPEIFSTPVRQGFSKFQEIFVQDIPEFEYCLQFSIIFKVPWILSWTFTVTPATGPSPPLLQRVSRIKWWEKIPEKEIQTMTIEGVSNYYSINFGIPATISPPLNPYSSNLVEEQEISQFLATNDKEEIRRLIKEIKKNSPTSSTVQDTQNDFQDSQDPYETVRLYD